jgi:hypothetical protein
LPLAVVPEFFSDGALVLGAWRADDLEAEWCLAQLRLKVPTANNKIVAA